MRIELSQEELLLMKKIEEKMSRENLIQEYGKANTKYITRRRY